MAGDKPKPDSHEADQERVQGQNGITDIANSVSHTPNGNIVVDMLRSALLKAPVVGDALRSRTNFENHRLNDMVDLVQRTRPEDLENAGKALWDARDAIKAAASELSGHIDRVHWVGESGDAFRVWGQNLVKHTVKLGDFADAAGTQITAAGSGLASVRSAMPPRDDRLTPKSVEDIPTPARIESNAEYTAAVKAEKHRQEAINQMNRLSSFYAVSGEFLEQQHPPTFDAMPDVGVPKPARAHQSFSSERETGQFQQEHSSRVVPQHVPPGTVTGDVRIDPVNPPVNDDHDTFQRPDVPVGTVIDSVDTRLPEKSGPVTVTTGTPPVPQGQSGPGVGPTSGPFGTGLVKPVTSGPAGRGLGMGGGPKAPLTAQGRAGQGALRGPGQGTSNPMGRATSTGQAGAKGGMTGGRPTASGRGISGGTPRVGGTSGGRPAGMGPAGAGRNNGVVGGRPVSGGGTSGKAGARVPRGTVIGGESEAGSRNTAGRIGQRGVMGAPGSATGTGQTEGRRLGGGAEGVTGTPQARGSAARAGRNGFTTGGSGLVRGPGEAGHSDEGEATLTPDHLVENEQPQLPDKPRRDVPPVIG
ncbi:hypothetical protein ACFVTY_15770 [Streptomyces sp. NPDC058067]|uniref:hypothetical protein n=1 Tax=Streptomyces sp. NPDC058067 TaxID=3346324 RepID=UPI0036EC71EA